MIVLEGNECFDSNSSGGIALVIGFGRVSVGFSLCRAARQKR